MKFWKVQNSWDFDRLPWNTSHETIQVQKYKNTKVQKHTLHVRNTEVRKYKMYKIVVNQGFKEIF